jgi:hypothetical protein
MRESWHETKKSDGVGGKLGRRTERVIISQGTAAAPDVSLEICLPRRADFCVPRRVCRFLQKEAIFQKITSWCEPIAHVRDMDNNAISCEKTILSIIFRSYRQTFLGWPCVSHTQSKITWESLCPGLTYSFIAFHAIVLNCIIPTGSPNLSFLQCQHI